MRLYPLRVGSVLPLPSSSSSLQCNSNSSRRALSLNSNRSSGSSKHKQKHNQINSWNSLLQLCTNASTLKQVHARYVIHGILHLSPALFSHLISSYARLGHLSQSLRILVHLQMRRRGGPEGCAPLLLDAPTLVALLRSCTHFECFNMARSLHRLAIITTTAAAKQGGGLTAHHHVNKALLSMYSKLGCLDMARAVFEHMPPPHSHCGWDTTAWNLMIAAESRHGHHRRAIQLLIRMGDARVKADLFTAIAAISAASELKALDRGREIHAHVIRNAAAAAASLSSSSSSSSSDDDDDDGGGGGGGTTSSTRGTQIISAVHNSLIEMYAKCGCLGQAKQVFDQLGDKSSVVSWSSMVRAYVLHGHPSDALALYEAMKLEGVKLVDRVSVINLLPACVQIGALGKVTELHLCCIKLGFDLHASVVTALLVSYAKCGCIEAAQKLFDEEEEAETEARDVISWNSMITAYAKHGNWPRCFQLYSSMKKRSPTVVPDCVTFIGLLTACVNSGLVDEGWNCFVEMVDVYGYQPKQEHYACMVDLLGRHGQVDEAMKLIKTMPFQPDVRVWGPLLSACKLHSKPADVAEFAAQRMIGMEPKNAGNYVLISNIYAAAGKWDQVAKMRGSLRDRGLKKTPGCSWLEINGSVHEFRVADRSHPMTEDIYAMLMNLQLEIIRMSKEMIGLEQTAASCLFELLR